MTTFGRTGPSAERRTTRLSRTQVTALLRMSASSDGWELAPGGYKGAGRDASRWWKTMHILAELGLVQREVGSHGFTITAQGRARARVEACWAAEELDSRSKPATK